MALFVPQNIDCSQYNGYIRIGLDEFKFSIRNIRYEGSQIFFDQACLDVETALIDYLMPHSNILQNRLRQSSSLSSFIHELEELVSVCLANKPEINKFATLPSAEFYVSILAELNNLGYEHLIASSENITQLELKTEDIAGRTHILKVHLPPSYPHEVPICIVDAPELFKPIWRSASIAGSGSNFSSSTLESTGSSCLKTLLHEFEHTFLSKFQVFWMITDDLDTNCCILEPQHPIPRSATKRRIAIDKFVSIKIEINPLCPKAICDVAFFGKESASLLLREQWNKHVFEWNEAFTVRKNLQNILGVQFPAPTKQKTLELQVECGICYGYQIDLSKFKDNENESPNAMKKQKTSNDMISNTYIIPDRMCENGKCNRLFHEKCLYEWLKSLPTARQSFNTIFGECPYCREAISAKYVVT